MRKYFYLVVILVFFSQCRKKEDLKHNSSISVQNIIVQNNLINKSSWLHKDIIKDTIPGISLERAHSSILKNRKKVIVAVIDNKFDINHEALKDFIWNNPNEVLNYKDDDGNGYIDDIYGWNFIGNEQGDNIFAANYEYVRYIRYYEGRFENMTIDNIPNQDKEKFRLYVEAKKKVKKELERVERKKDYLNKLQDSYLNARNALQSYFPNYQYTKEILKTIDTVGNDLAVHVKEISQVIKWEETDEMNMTSYQSFVNEYQKNLNINFNERGIIGDNPYDILDTIYGNNKTFNYLKEHSHGTRVSSIITGVFNQVPNTLKILPISVSPHGNYYDKDLALAIRYAVNQGAKVINMSFSKNEYAIHPEWVYDAIKYAEDHNVLLVTSAGNGNVNIDDFKYNYPSDTESNESKELTDNFLMVGSSSYQVNENLKSYFSSYGKNSVDIFAPGQELQTAYPFNKYKEDSGTSLSCALTSGVAALLFSYYPNLTASEVKQIIMDSGVEYTIPVKVPTKEDKERTIPFNELSKSGKIVNAYNALLMAEKIAKEK